MSFFRRKVQRLTPPAVLTDKVVPVHYWDHHCANAVIDFMLRFDHKLDAGKLRSSLERLLDRRDGWRKLGARVRLNASGKLDYHVPTEYTRQRPAISYHHRSYHMSIMQHPLASRLPKASASWPSPSSSSTTPGASDPRIMGRGDDFVQLMRRPEDPTCFEDYLYADRPMLGLHIVTFNDATLVSLSASHILFDAMGRKELLNAWSLTLQGREDDVAPLIEDDPLNSLGLQKQTKIGAPLDEYKHAAKQLSMFQMVTLGLRQVLYKILHRKPLRETRTICVPAAYVDSLRRNALLELQLHDDDHAAKQVIAPAFLSDGDVLCAWWTRHIVSSRLRNSPKSHQTVAIMNMMGLRGLLSQQKLLPGKKSALVANAMVAVPTFILAKNIVTKPLGCVAAALRKTIEQLGTRPQVEALLALQRAANDKKGGPPALFGDAGMHMIVCTNWTKAEFYDVDFSAAVVVDEAQGQDHVPGLGSPRRKPERTDTNMDGRRLEQKVSMHAHVAKPTNIQMHLITTSTPEFMMNIFSVLGRDSYGNYWIIGVLGKHNWDNIEQVLHQELSEIKH